jgi:hypothetical protein
MAVFYENSFLHLLPDSIISWLGRNAENSTKSFGYAASFFSAEKSGRGCLLPLAFA